MKGRLLAAAFLAALLGCTSPAPQTSGLRLTKIGFTELPGWHADATALASFQRSCAILAAKPDAAPMGGAGYAGTVGDWRQACAAAGGGAAEFFERNFTPFLVSGSDALFTGYYEPEIRASRSRHDAFQTPVYGLPSDLVRAELGLFNPKLQGEHISGRIDGQRLVPYAERAEINAKGVATAPVLFFTDDPVALFFLQIQGSGRVLFDDGTSARLGYAGENGQPYTAIGRTLIAENALTRENVSLQSIRAWLKANPARAQSVMETNRSYIFFAESPLEKNTTGDTALGPKGNLGANLTPLASLAVDPRLHALGAPFFVAAQGADPVHGVMVAQDIGGAIRGAVRGDIFFGFGAEAERRAGAMKGTGALYVLLPNALAARIGKGHDYPS
ncbi:MAG TPA: murein transglycosylase A [Rhizomicrobium sp.]|nr:murein transglycosylase A [Rhizomicrobium sp.]